MPLPDDMDDLIQGLLAEADMAPDSFSCSRAFQADLHAFLTAQVTPASLAMYSFSNCSRDAVTLRPTQAYTAG